MNASGRGRAGEGGEGGEGEGTLRGERDSPPRSASAPDPSFRPRAFILLLPSPRPIGSSVTAPRSSPPPSPPRTLPADVFSPRLSRLFPRAIPLFFPPPVGGRAPSPPLFRPPSSLPLRPAESSPPRVRCVAVRPAPSRAHAASPSIPLSDARVARPPVRLSSALLARTRRARSWALAPAKNRPIFRSWTPRGRRLLASISCFLLPSPYVYAIDKAIHGGKGGKG